MRKRVGIIKRVTCLGLVFLLSINSFAAIVSDNDGSAFITKSEFDALKSSFQSQIDSYNNSIDSKIDGAIASYLAGIKISNQMEITPLIECSTEKPYRVVANDYDSRHNPILPSFNFSSIRMHQLGGCDARPFRRYQDTWVEGSKQTIPSWNTSGSSSSATDWSTTTVKSFFSALGSWNDSNENICYELNNTDSSIINTKCKEKLVISGSIVLWENGWKGKDVFHCYQFSDKLFNGRKLGVEQENKVNFRGLNTYAAQTAAGVYDVFNDGKTIQDVGQSAAQVTFLKNDVRRNYTADPGTNVWYFTTAAGGTDIYRFNTKIDRSAVVATDSDCHYTYLKCEASNIYAHKSADDVVEVFDDTFTDANSMKKYYFGKLADRKLEYLAWGEGISESDMAAITIYDALKWPRIKIKNTGTTSTNLASYYNGNFSYNSSGTKKKVHFYGGFPLFVADRDYTKVEITLTEKKGTATGTQGRIWLKKDEFINESDLTKSAWGTERSKLLTINDIALNSAKNYGFDISFDTVTKLTIKDIKKNDEVFLRFADNLNGTGCLIDSMQIIAEIAQ